MIDSIPQRKFIRRGELSLATPEEIKTALGKQGVTDNKRKNIKKGGEEIQTRQHFDI